MQFKSFNSRIVFKNMFHSLSFRLNKREPHIGPPTRAAYPELYSFVPFLRQVYKHEHKDCKVCLTEEKKSIQAGLQAPMFNKSLLIQRQIFPSNYCWFCKQHFEDSQAQLVHFTQIHECDFCMKGFENEIAKQNHKCGRKFIAF